MRGLAGDRGLDALLESPVSKLHQGVLVEPEKRNLPFPRRGNQRGRTRTQLLALRKADEVIAFFVKIEIAIDFTAELFLEPVR